MDRVKADLGPNAVMMNQPREVSKGGIKGMLGKKVWEVVAYCPQEDSLPETPRPAHTPAPAPVPPVRKSAVSPDRAARAKIRQPVDHMVDEPALPFAELPKPPAKLPPVRNPMVYGATSREFQPAPAIQTQAASPAWPPAAQKSVASLNLDDPAIRTLFKEIRAISEKLSNPPPAPASDQVILPGVLPAFYSRLMTQEVPREIAIELMNSLCERPTLDLNDEMKVQEILEEQLAAAIPSCALDDLFGGRGPRVVFMVGPAGVGKTTTLTKIAALSSRDQKMKVALITLDIHRVAAAEQLKSYAELITADFELVFNEEEFASAVVKHSDKDMILVDTPGRNPCSPAALSDFSGYIKKLTAIRLPSPAVLLVLSATTKPADLQRYVSCYRSLDPAGVVFTKADETSTFGSLMPILLSKLPFVFMTCGQDVPDDIEPANSRRLARKILR